MPPIDSLETSMASAPALLGVAYLISVAWPLAKIDLAQHRLPNRLVFPAFPVTLIGQLAALALGESWLRLVLALVVAIICFGLGFAANRFAGLGMGDVKLFTAMALALGWWGVSGPVLALIVALGLATIVVIWLMVTRKAKIGSSIALGPYLLLGLIGSTAWVFTGQGLS